MDIDHLTHHEFVIECQVRGLSGSASENYKELKERIALEAETPLLIPDRPHEAAKKNPKREIQLCGEKLRDLQCWMQSNVVPEDPSELSKVESRVLHIQGRLIRLQYSKTALREVSYKVVGRGCTVLLKSVQKAIQENTSLETSMHDINGISWDGVEEPEDSSSDSDFDKVKAGRKVQFAKEICYAISQLQKTQTDNSETFVKNGTENVLKPASTSSPGPSSSTFTGFHKPPVMPTQSPTHTSVDELSRLLDNIKDLTGPPPTNLASQKTAGQGSERNISSQGNIPHNSAIPSGPSISNTGNYSNLHGPPPPQFSGYTSTSQPFSAANPIWSHLAACNPQDFATGSSSDAAKNLKHWNIHFEGSPGGLSVEKFIFQIEFLALAYHVSHTRLTREISVLLRGEAYHWYWNYIQRHGLVPWTQLRSEFLNMYKDRRTDDDIRRDLESRKQKYDQGETFLTFYNEILAMSLNFSYPFPDSELLRILKQNMRPGLQIALEGVSILDLRSLIQRSVAFEDKWKRLNYNPEWACQGRRQVNEISYGDFPDSSQVLHSPASGISSYPAPSDTISFYNPGNEPVTETPVTPEICAFAQSNSSNNQIPRNIYSVPDREKLAICWNCKDIGHYYQHCLQPIKHQFCFGCGLADTFKPNCYRCKASGNVMPRARFAGKSPLTNQQSPNANPHQASTPRILQNPATGRQGPPL